MFPEQKEKIANASYFKMHPCVSASPVISYKLVPCDTVLQALLKWLLKNSSSLVLLRNLLSVDKLLRGPAGLCQLTLPPLCWLNTRTALPAAIVHLQRQMLNARRVFPQLKTLETLLMFSICFYRLMLNAGTGVCEVGQSIGGVGSWCSKPWQEFLVW